MPCTTATHNCDTQLRASCDTPPAKLAAIPPHLSLGWRLGCSLAAQLVGAGLAHCLRPCGACALPSLHGSLGIIPLAMRAPGCGARMLLHRMAQLPAPLLLLLPLAADLRLMLAVPVAFRIARIRKLLALALLPLTTPLAVVPQQARNRACALALPAGERVGRADAATSPLPKLLVRRLAVPAPSCSGSADVHV